MKDYKFLINQEVYVIQHHELGNYFFEECKSIEEAAEQDWEEHFFISEQDQMDANCMLHEDDALSYEEQREEHRNSFEQYNKDQILKMAKDGYEWPMDLGILEEIEQDEEEEE